MHLPGVSMFIQAFVLSSCSIIFGGKVIKVSESLSQLRTETIVRNPFLRNIKLIMPVLFLDGHRLQKINMFLWELPFLLCTLPVAPFYGLYLQMENAVVRTIECIFVQF